MAKAKGNPKIAEYGKNTQFGNGLDAVECGKAGVEKREEKKAEKKTIACALELILNAKIPDSMAKKMQAQTGVSEIDYRTALAYSVISTAIKKGDANALRTIADYTGEKPANNININADENSKFADILEQLGGGSDV